MNPSEVTAELEGIADAGDDFEWQSLRLTEKWKSDPNGFEAVEPILRFMEKHPGVDYGAPGPLVHFVECFHCLHDYQGKLVQSVERQPTPHTVGMLNRMINGTPDPTARQALISVLERVLHNAAADPMTRERAFDYLEHQARH